MTCCHSILCRLAIGHMTLKMPLLITEGKSKGKKNLKETDTIFSNNELWEMNLKSETMEFY